MSKEVLELVQGMGWDAIETQLALQCAPLLTGIKISNILILQSENVQRVRSILEKTSIQSFVLYESGKKTTLLLFREAELMKYLNQKEVKELFEGFGYYNLDLYAIIQLLRKRYDAYMKCKTEFPHELGLMLGYPTEDVLGFIENNGKNYLYSGYWKVYGNVSEKISLFERFEQAKEQVIQLISNGVGIVEIIADYQKENKLQVV